MSRCVFLAAAVVMGLALGCDTRRPEPTVPPTLAARATGTVASAAPAPVPALDAAALRAEAAAGKLPSAPERDLTRAHCGICHDEKYLVQQRLTPEQWKKTVEKMKTFGAPVPHSEAARIADYLARSFPVDLPAAPVVMAKKPE